MEQHDILGQEVRKSVAINVLVCDDNVAEAEQLQKLISSYGERTGVNFEMTVCTTPRDIICRLQDSDQQDILFLDIYLDQLNGMDLARLVRKNNDKSKIVFVSSSNDHALEAFGVNASQYLVKPVCYSSLAQTMDLLLKEPHGGGFIHVTSNNQIVKIFLNDLVYTETQRHYQALFLSNGTMERARMTRAELCDLLGPQKRFIRVGASFLVNLDYVVRVASDSIELMGGRVLHIPRRVLAEVKQQYFDYYCGGEEMEP